MKLIKTSGMNMKEKKGFEPYEVDDAMHTLMKAEEHKANPELMKHVHKKLKGKKKAITSLQQLRSLAQEKANDHDDDDMDMK